MPGVLRASGVERQQLRWVALAAAVIALLLVVIVAAVAIGAPAVPDPGLVGTACLVVLTLGISAATLRYRLYDLDRVISRSWPTGCSRSCLAPPMPWSASASAGCCPEAPA